MMSDMCKNFSYPNLPLKELVRIKFFLTVIAVLDTAIHGAKTSRQQISLWITRSVHFWHSKLHKSGNDGMSY